MYRRSRVATSRQRRQPSARHSPGAARNTIGKIDVRASSRQSDPQIAAPITRKRQNRISWIWLVPVVAALMGLSLVVRTWLQAGTDISITFNSADGLEVGKTACATRT